VHTTEDQTVAASHSVDPTRWQAGLEELLGRVAGRFGRVELRRRARAFVGGLLADLPRKNCWTLAEHAGDPSPDGMQHLLARAVWDHDKVRDDVRDYLVEHLGDPEAVLVVDETATSRTGRPRMWCSASTPAPPGGWRTPRSRSTWCTPAAPATP
jgi:SRSO17 transposase